MKKKAKKQPAAIQAVDEVLDLLREKLQATKDDKKKVDLMKKVDAVLDERLRLMKLRDAGEI